MKATRTEEWPEGTLSAKEVCAEVGITYRQLDYWSRQRLIPGYNEDPGTGYVRLYTEKQVDFIRALKRASTIQRMALPALAKLVMKHGL